MKGDTRLKATSTPLSAPISEPTAQATATASGMLPTVAVHQHGATDSGQRDHRADREIDAAEDHHLGHADRGDADRRRLAQHVEDIGRLQEGVGNRERRKEKTATSTTKIA